jgi:hypothetical protein
MSCQLVLLEKGMPIKGASKAFLYLRILLLANQYPKHPFCIGK